MNEQAGNVDRPMSGADIEPGSPLPGFTVEPDAVQLFCYSAITWNPHRIHYDDDFARGHEGYDGVLVQGPLIGSWLMRLCETWVKGWGTVVDIDYRARTAVTVGQKLRIGGEVTQGGSDPEADIWAETENGTKATLGHVVVESFLQEKEPES